MLLSIECIGLLCLLDREVFLNYIPIFEQILTDDFSSNTIKEKIIALRSSVDALIIHGMSKDCAELYSIITEDYLVIRNKTLR